MYRDKTIVLYRARKGKQSRGKSSVQSLQPGACRADLLGNSPWATASAWGYNAVTIIPSIRLTLQYSAMKFKELGRRAKDFLNINRSQSNSRLPSPDTVHPHTRSKDLSPAQHTSSGVSLAQCSSKLIV